MEITVEKVFDIDVPSLDRMYKWLAVDGDGWVCAYEKKPFIKNEEWENQPGTKFYWVESLDTTVDNWKDLCLEINRGLPIGTLIVFDLAKTSSFGGLAVGVITHDASNSGLRYSCDCLNEIGPLHQYVSDEAIVAAYDPITHKRLV